MMSELPQSNLELTSPLLVSFQTIIYYSKGRVKEREVRELASVEGGDKIGPKSVSEWRGKTLMIPPLPPTNLRGCHLIKIYYDLVVSFPFFPPEQFFFSLIPWVFFLSFLGAVHFSSSNICEISSCLPEEVS